MISKQGGTRNTRQLQENYFFKLLILEKSSDLLLLMVRALHEQWQWQWWLNYSKLHYFQYIFNTKKNSLNFVQVAGAHKVPYSPKEGGSSKTIWEAFHEEGYKGKKDGGKW